TIVLRCSDGFHAWNIKTGMKLSLQGPSGLVCSMTIKDVMMFAGTADGRIKAWKFPAKDINSEQVAILAGHDRHVISLAVSTTRLYSGSLDKTIRVWDLKNLQCVQTLSEHKAAVTSELCWGQKLLSCSLDKTVKVWVASESGDLQLMHTHSEEHEIVAWAGPTIGTSYTTLCSLENKQHAHLASPWAGACFLVFLLIIYQFIFIFSNSNKSKKQFDSFSARYMAATSQVTMMRLRPAIAPTVPLPPAAIF
ncbi:zinc finger CCCH domain-containing protein 17-like, partial [Hordeum vulgare subsp. vulgare]|uniref:zinc finger CCCH domain-containing protein 17-like n=1 Tax=Hordeum vulgare subsp. vulgare TaxID=112509 RepID=UPI001D1A4B31